MSDVKAISRDTRFSSHDQDWREGKGYVLLAAIAISVIAAILAVLMRDTGGRILLSVLSVFAAGGVFSLFAIGLGFLRFADASPKETLARQFADNTNIAAAITASDGEVVYANPAYFSLFSQANSMTNRPQAQFAGSEEADSAMFRLTRAAVQRNSHTEIVRQALNGGAERWLRVSVEPVKRRRDMHRRMSLWQFVDITDEHTRDAEMSSRLAELNSYLDTAPVGLLMADDKGRVARMNATLLKWLGLEQKHGQKELAFTDLFPAEEAQIILDHATKADAVSATVPYVAQSDVIAADGSPFAAWIIAKVVRHPGTREHQIYVAVLKDLPVPEERTCGATEEITQSHFFDAAPIAIATVDAKGRVHSRNAAFLRTFDIPMKRRRRVPNLLKLVGDSARDEVARLLHEAAEGKPPASPVDIVFDGETKRTGQLYIVPLSVAESGDSKDVAVVYAIDTSEQRALEEQIAQSQKMQAVGQLAGGIAHDFNNVLTAIIGYSDLLLASHRPADPAFKDIMNIKQNANRAAALVRHLLAFSRRQTLRPKVLSLTDVIEEFSILLGRLIGEKVTARMMHGRDLWLVKADSNQLEQVIMNLAVNARDAMLPQGGELTIRTANVPERESMKLVPAGVEPGEYVLLEVSDTGCGMPQDVLDKIFEPFFSTKEVGKGTGLGLSTVYGIVKQTGGYIFAESRVGEGTTFKIYLPRYIEDESGVAAEEPKQEKKEAQRDLTGSETILLVEDEEAVRGFASRALTTRGYKVVQATSGVEALEVMAEHEGEIDLVISDVVMPEMDGPTLLKQLRKRNPDLKIIFISGYAEEAFRNNLDEGENFAFLPKPFSLKKLAAAVKETLG